MTMNDDSSKNILIPKSSEIKNNFQVLGPKKFLKLASCSNIFFRLIIHLNYLI